MARNRRTGIPPVSGNGRWDGPQRITVHSREEVVIVSIEEYRGLEAQPTGQALVELLHDSPLRDLNFERVRTRSRDRGVEL
jgi:hypothetical protein